MNPLLFLRKIDFARHFLASILIVFSLNFEISGTALAHTISDKKIADKWALVVGISEFNDSRLNLESAASDALSVSNFLVDEAKFAPDHVRTLLNDTATRVGIISNIAESWLPAQVQQDDLVVIYVATHGYSESTEADRLNYLIAADSSVDNLDATAITLRQLKELLRKVRCARKVLILDACHSGGRSHLGAKPVNFYTQDLDECTDLTVLCSSESDQKSWESTEYKGGVFTQQLLKALRKQTVGSSLYKVFDEARSKVSLEVQGVEAIGKIRQLLTRA